MANNLDAENLGDFFSESKLNETVQLRVGNVPLGTHRVKFIDMYTKKSNGGDATKDRIELLFEYVKSTDAGCIPGNKGTIAVFRGLAKYNYCEKTLVRFAQEGSGDESIVRLKDALDTLKLLKGYEVDIVCALDTNGKKDKEGNYYKRYTFGLFDIKE